MSETKWVTSGTGYPTGGEGLRAVCARAEAALAEIGAEGGTRSILPMPDGSVLAVRRVAEGDVLVVLFAADGADRAEFGTACEICYGIYIADGEREIFLPDLARDEREAFAIFAKFADGGVTPDTALEVADALLG